MNNKPNHDSQPPKYLDLAITRREAHTIQAALAYYSQEMHNAAQELKTEAKHHEAQPWTDRATASATVLVQLNRILATDHLARRGQPPTQPEPLRDPFTAQAAAFFDTAGKFIAVFLAILATYAALALSIK